MTETLGVVVAFSAGMLSFLSPCVLPCSLLPLVHHGHVGGAPGRGARRARTRPDPGPLAGLHRRLQRGVREPRRLVQRGRQFLLDYRDWIRLAGGALIVVFGLYVAGVLRIGAFTRTRQLQLRSKPAGLLGSFAVGLTFAIGWTPCVEPILGSILTLASNEDTVSQGVGLLLAYSAGSASRSSPSRWRSAASSASSSGIALIPVVERAAGDPPGDRRGPGAHQLLHCPERVGDEHHPEWLMKRL